MKTTQHKHHIKKAKQEDRDKQPDVKHRQTMRINTTQKKTTSEREQR